MGWNRGGRRWGAALCATAVLASLGGPPVHAAGPCPTSDCDPQILARRTLSAALIHGAPPVIDGHLDEAAWSEATVASAFVESSPRPGAPASLRSEARVLVDGQALYVGLKYYDPEPARILAPLVRRDDETTSDWAFVEIDSRHDRRTGFSFGLNPRGVQVDGLWLNDTNYDSSWNAVWEGGAAVDGEGWTAEFRIPFSQLPFSPTADARELVWGINFYRYSPAHGESSNWSPRYRGLGGIVSNFNDLQFPAPGGVRRLEVVPYLAPRVGNEEPGTTHASVKAGADVRVGLGSGFNLTATLLPDFGQVEADPSQVNLTAFELFQAERRPFFLEGLEIFRFDTSLPFATRGLSFAEESPFYSRRVGRAPQGEPPAGAIVQTLPASTTLLGAAKLTGQTAQGWTLGVFTALADRAEARLQDTPRGWPVDARTALTVARAIKSLNHGDSSLSLFLSDLHRFDLAPALAPQELRDAAAAGAELQHRFGDRNYEWRSWALGSLLHGDPAAIARVTTSATHRFQRPDAAQPVAAYGTTLSGLAGETRLSRIGGAFRWDLVGRAVSRGFDVNETGFQRSSDWLLLAGSWRYERFRPGRWIRSWSVGSANLGWGWSLAGEPRARVVDAYAAIETREVWSVKLGATRELEALSFDWLRGGPALRMPARTQLTLSLLSDQRKPSSAGLDAAVRREPGSGSWSFSAAPSLTVRASDRLLWSGGASYQLDTVGWQPLGRLGTQNEDVVGRVRQRTLAFTLRADLTFSPRLALQAYLQPFGTLGRYDRFQGLAAPRDPLAARRFQPLGAEAIPGGRLGLDLDGDGRFDTSLASPDGHRRTLDGSLVLRWEYRPGSFLTAVWNHQRATSSLDTPSLWDVLGGVVHDPPRNVVLVKLSLRVAP
jgi:hypothetical protein